MAEKRMFAKSIVLSDAFLDMPLSARCLYFTLGMLADDDGFIGNPKSIMRQCGASQDDMLILLQKRFLLSFDSGVIVIKHWRINNYLRSDRHLETTYIEEKSTLAIDEKGAYTEANRLGIPVGNQLVYPVKNSIDKNSIEENNNKELPKNENKYFEDDNLNKSFSDFVSMRNKIKKPMTAEAVKRAISKLKTLAGDDTELAIAIIEQSVDNCWKGLFEIKGRKPKKVEQKKEETESAPVDYGWEDD